MHACEINGVSKVNEETKSERIEEKANEDGGNERIQDA
jgi:hypothetical protein